MSQFVFPDLPDQLGLASTSQLLKAGATEWDLNRLALNGQRVVRGVYRSGVGALVYQQLLMAGVLWAGPRSALTGTHALAAHGLPGVRPGELIRLLVPPQHRARRNARGMVTERTRRMPRAHTKAGIPVAQVERALVDAGRRRELSRTDLMACTIATLQRRLSTLERISAEIGTVGDAGTGGVQDGLLAYRDGAWSRPEAILIDAVRDDPAMPAMLANVRLEDSRQFHTGTEGAVDRWVETLEKDVYFQRHGLVVVRVAPMTLYDDLPGFMDSLASVVASRSGCAPSDVVVVPALHS